MAIDTAQKRSIVSGMGQRYQPVYPTGTVDEQARGGVLGLYYETPPAPTGRRYWRRLGRRVAGGR